MCALLTDAGVGGGQVRQQEGHRPLGASPSVRALLQRHGGRGRRGSICEVQPPVICAVTRFTAPSPTRLLRSNTTSVSKNIQDFNIYQQWYTQKIENLSNYVRIRIAQFLISVFI